MNYHHYNFKRSIFIIKDIKNETLNKNTKIIRPGYGIQPKYYDFIMEEK